MLKKILFLILFLFLFTTKAYAASPTTTYALSGSLTATNSSGISFFTLSGSTDTITGSNEAIGSITYSGGSFSNNIVIETGAGSTSPCPSGYTQSGTSCVANLSSGTANWTVTPAPDTGLSTNTVNAVANNNSSCADAISGQEISYTSNANVPNGQYTFETTFNSGSSGTLSINLSVDDYATVYLNGQVIGQTDTGGQPTSCSDWNGDGVTDDFTYSGSVVQGSNTLQIVDTNDDGNASYENGGGPANPMGITANVQVTSSSSPSCPSGTTLVNGECVSGYVLSGSGDTISYNGNSITYDSSTNTFSGSIPLSLTETLTEPATCSNGSASTSGSCSGGAYLTCATSGYTLSGSTCSETVSGSFTLSGSSSNIDISGGNSSGSISMTQTEECPTGYTLSSGSCVANTDAGATSTFVCTDGTNYQNCDSGSLLPSGSAYLCPLGQTQCNENTSTPQCPSGYTWNGSSCVSTASTSCPSGYTWNGSTCINIWANWVQITNTNNPNISYNISASGAGCSSSGSTSVSNGMLKELNITCWASGSQHPTVFWRSSSSTSSSFVMCDDNNVYVKDINGNLYVAGTGMSGIAPGVGGYEGIGWNCSNTVSPNYTTTSATCPSSTTLINGECVSYSCPLSGTPQGSAPGQNYTCVEPSGSSNYYCSPNLCYNDTTNTPVSTPETMPAPQTNNGKVTSSGCSGSIYIFPGQALQCTRDFVLGENCCSRGKFLLGGRSCSSNSQILAEAIIYDKQYSPPVPVYSGSGDMNTAPITSCSESSIATGCGQQGEAIYLGDYCSLKLPVIGTCLAQTYVFCKFQGLLATIIQAQGRAQLAGGPDAVSWGSVSSPNCTGFTPTQFQELNFADMNLSQYIAVIKNQVGNTLTTSVIQQQITNTTNSIGNEINQLETGGALTGTTP